MLFELETKKVSGLAMQASLPEATREVVWAGAFRESKNVQDEGKQAEDLGRNPKRRE